MAGKGGRRSTSFKPGQSGNPGGKPKLIEPARKILADIKLLAKEASEEAIKTLTAVMGDKAAPPAARVGAATAILDRGYGKPSQTIEANVTFLDKLSDAERIALLAVLDAIEGDQTGVGEGASGTLN